MKPTSVRRKVILLAAAAAIFLAWRFTRDLNIYGIGEGFARPLSVDLPEWSTDLSAKSCGECHLAIYQEWQQTMHAQAWTDPYFQGSSLNFPVKSSYGSPRSVKLLIPPTCLAGEARCEAPRLS